MEEEKSPLFTELSSEESAAVSGGGSRVSFDVNTYLFILGAGVLFGNPGLTSEEIQFAWEQSFVSNKRSSSRRKKRFLWW